MRYIRYALILGIILITTYSFSHVKAADGNFGGGGGSANDPYLIEDVFDLQAMKNDLDAYYVLVNDIDASVLSTQSWGDGGKGFEPIGNSSQYSFTGHFDGRNHTIRNLYIKKVSIPVSQYTGLFGYVGTDAVIKNVNLVDVNIIGEDYTGCIAGFCNRGRITNCYVEGNIVGINKVGGVVGELSYGYVTDCQVRINITENMTKFSPIKGYLGGIAGVNFGGEISGCSANVNLSGSDFLGGLVGYNTGTIEQSCSLGKIEGDKEIGGFAGRNSGEISKCYAKGEVVGDYIYVGGFVGINLLATSGMETYHGEIMDSYSMVDVSSRNYPSVAGFVGRNERGIIRNCYSTGEVNYTDDNDPTDKGFAGTLDTSQGFEMIGNFWDVDSSKQVSSAGYSMGRSTSDMKKKSTFTSVLWDFENTWAIIDSEIYPFLRWQDKSSPTADAGSPLVVDTGSTVTFDGTGSLDDMGIANYSWRFTYDNQEIILYGPTPIFTFSTPGTYEVTLTVVDALGKSDSDNVTINVLPVEINVTIWPVKDEDNKLVSGATVTIIFNGKNYSGVTDENGAAVIILPYSAVDEELNIYIEKQGYKSISYTAVLQANGELDTPPPIFKPVEQSNTLIYLIVIIVIIAAVAIVFIKKMK